MKKDLDKRVLAWSWGGFGLEWFYLTDFKGKSWWIYLVLEGIILTLNSNWSIPLGLISAIYLGIYGRRLAWKNGGWSDIDKFLDEQKTWDFCGKFVLGIFAFFAVLGFVLMFVGK